MFAARAVCLCLALKPTLGLVAGRSGAARPNCTSSLATFKGPVMPAELGRIVQRQESDCQNCAGFCPPADECLGCQHDRCDSEMVSRIWQNVPNRLRMLPNDIVKPFFSKSTALLMVGDSIMRQQYHALRRILIESAHVEDISVEYFMSDYFTMGGAMEAYRRQDTVLTILLGHTAWTFPDVHLRDLESKLQKMVEPSAPSPKHRRPEQIIVFFDIGTHYNNVYESDKYETELRNMFKHAKGTVQHLQSKWEIPVRLVISEPNAQHFLNGDYQDGDQWCVPVCSKNTSPNERLDKFREVLDGLSDAARAHFDIFDGYNVTSSLYFAHSSPVGRCHESPHDCTHYCHFVWYFWLAALSRSGLL